jgi:pyridoxal phosphate enzyme (YggS family)
MDLKENYQQLKTLCNENSAKLIGISKVHPVDKIKEVYDWGHRDFGENKAQELQEKQPSLPDDINWHFVGHLQSNKVKYIAPFVHLIHSIDSLKVLKEVDKEAGKNDRVVDVLLQVKIAREPSKFGFKDNEVLSLVDSEDFKELSNIRVCGLMGLASLTDDKTQLRSEFSFLRNLFQRLASYHFQHKFYFKELSMGMSGDYEEALAEGSTMIRVGSAIFGPRS